MFIEAYQMVLFVIKQLLSYSQWQSDVSVTCSERALVLYFPGTHINMYH